MKTAREICEEIQNEKINSIIKSVQNGFGSATYQYVQNLDLETEAKLTELGFKIEKGIYKNIKGYQNKYIDEVFVFNFFGFKFNKKVKRFAGEECVYEEIPFVKVYVCCGDNESN